ncbi:unnamed protein product [Lasius platythorax]|uniref:Uncharacterized protein n=1 Tax=Lasius platythorax TaxID=488582 RepID=A0AAV2NFF0_9HYME
MNDSLILRLATARSDGASYRHTQLGFTDDAFSLFLHFSGCETGFEENETPAGCRESGGRTRQRDVVQHEGEKEGLL